MILNTRRLMIFGFAALAVAGGLALAGCGGGGGSSSSSASGDVAVSMTDAPGTPRALDLDFDLDSSVVVDPASNTIFMTPVLNAEVEARRPRLSRVRGPLLRADTGRQAFVLALRPRPNVAPFGAIEVTST